MTGPIILTLTPGDRLQLATTIERLINMLDAMDGDADYEPYLAGNHGTQDDREADYDAGPLHSGDSDQEADFADDEPTLGSSNDTHGSGNQTQWVSSPASSDEREEENEHGGDIQDEPHDKHDEGDDEPFLGWRETCCQKGRIGLEDWNGVDDQGAAWADVRLSGEGYTNARNALRKTLGKKPLQVSVEYRERATRLTDGTVFRTLVVPSGFIPVAAGQKRIWPTHARD
jgi:hypothetical protein